MRQTDRPTERSTGGKIDFGVEFDKMAPLSPGMIYLALICKMKKEAFEMLKKLK